MISIDVYCIIFLILLVITTYLLKSLIHLYYNTIFIINFLFFFRLFSKNLRTFAHDIKMDKQNVYDLLARYSGRTNLSEAQKRELRRNVIIDFVEFYYSRFRWTLKIIKCFHLAMESPWFISFVHPRYQILY